MFEAYTRVQSAESTPGGVFMLSPWWAEAHPTRSVAR